MVSDIWNKRVVEKVGIVMAGAKFSKKYLGVGLAFVMCVNAVMPVHAQNMNNDILINAVGEQEPLESEDETIELEWKDGQLYCKDVQIGEYKIGWQVVDGKTYYFHPVHYIAVKDIQKIDDKLYYFSPKTCELLEGVYKTKNGKRYYFQKEGGVKYGIQEWDGNYYCLRKRMSGEAVYGLNSYDGKLYYFDESTGAARKNWKYNLSHIIFTFGEDGVATNIEIEPGYENDMRTKLCMVGISYLGTKYDYDCINGLSCGPFVASCCQDVGLSDVVGNSYEQARYMVENGKLIERSELKPGDLMYWEWLNCDLWYAEHGGTCDHWDEIHHAAIYLGDGKVVECAESEGEVVVQNLHEYDGFTIKYCARIIADEDNGNDIDIPSNIKAGGDNFGGITVSWDTCENVDGYVIYRKAPGEERMTYRAIIEDKNRNTYYDVGLRTNEYYFYRVYGYKEIDGKKVFSYSGGPRNYVYAQCRMAKVTGLKVTQNGSSGIKIAWDKSNYPCDSYAIYRRSADEKSFTFVTITNNLSYFDKNVTDNTTYFYRVYPMKRINGKVCLGTSDNYVYSIR